jgi:hypothetical protein
VLCGEKYRGVGGLVLFLLAGGVWFSFWRDWLSKLVCIWGPRDSEGHEGGGGGVGVDRGAFFDHAPTLDKSPVFPNEIKGLHYCVAITHVIAP